MSPTERICARAHDLGFDLVGVASAYPVPYLDAYNAWIDQGYHGEMGYLARPDRVERRENPDKILSGVRSVVCVGLNYYPRALPTDQDPTCGLISNYAWGVDYHDLMMPRLEELAAFISVEVGAAHGVSCRAYVDTGPILERAYAARAGLGFIGKNTCLIHRRIGSWLFLGEILVDVELEPTAEQTGISCGNCRRCLDACPTGALVAPYVLDARRCISYLTIELQGVITPELRPLMGNWIYGCDVCQMVCPWQRFAKPTAVRSLRAEGTYRAAPALLDLIAMDEEAFRRQCRGTPIFRIGRRRLLRNVAVALGNRGNEQTTPSLEDALILGLKDTEPLVRGHVAWALGRIGSAATREALESTLRDERDPYVRREIQMAVDASQCLNKPNPQLIRNVTVTQYEDEVR
jgi:epoxyqueuosine reductase